MQALDLLLNRRSQPRLCEPAPVGQYLENILQAGLCAPDHKCLRPWRLIVCTGEGLIKLGKIFERAAIMKGAVPATLERAPKLPMRAPMVIVAICNYKHDDKVPRVEQIASTACAVHGMQMAAIAQGFQGIWRTGWYAQNDDVKALLGCKNEDEILGFLYVGSSPLKNMPRRSQMTSEHVEIWD